ncbi:hypothetical protein KA005_19135, partial [bacterium]|nr:hypothetical protein [bacterium]
MLYTANIGLQLMAEDNSKTVGAGLRIAVVFGRHVTNGLQRLRSLIPEFNDWYTHYVNEMKNDELMKYVYEIRNIILKGTILPLTQTYIIKDKKKNDLDKPKYTELSKDFDGNPIYHIEPLTG